MLNFLLGSLTVPPGKVNTLMVAPLEVLAAGPTVATTEVEGVDGGPPRGCWWQVRQRPQPKLKAGPLGVSELEFRECPPSTLRNVDDKPPGGAGAEAPRAPTINTKKHLRWASGRCRSWRFGSAHHQC
jgi:hypothetical protein